MTIDFDIKCPRCKKGIADSHQPSIELDGAEYCTCYRCKIDFWIRRRS